MVLLVYTYAVPGNNFWNCSKERRGYHFVARYLFKGNMKVAYEAVSSLFKMWKELDWQVFPCTIKEYDALRIYA